MKKSPSCSMQCAQRSAGPGIGCYKNLLQLEFSFKEFLLQPASRHSVTLADKIQIQVLSVCAAGDLGLSKGPGGSSISTSSDHVSSRRNLNYIHSTQYPETILFFKYSTFILLIKK